MNRRQALLSLGGGCAALLLGSQAAEAKRNRLGIVIYALGIHQQHNWAGRHQGLAPGLAFLEESHQFGAGSIQFPIGPNDVPHLSELRRRAEKYAMSIEASINPPATDADVARFENDVRVAKDAGAVIARTVLMPGRRYEQFKTLAEFIESEKNALKSLQLAEPVVARHRFHLAVENHKDQLIAEKLDTLKRVSSEWIGMCVDVGNNFALMEDPLETVRAFAPFALTVHIKDMVAQPYADGWLLADVALGDGFLDLKKIVDVLRASNPDVKFNLETITRDPLKIPVRTENFWATFPSDRTVCIERASAIIKSKSGVDFPGSVSTLPVERQLALERLNVERSFAYAQKQLSL